MNTFKRAKVIDLKTEETSTIVRCKGIGYPHWKDMLFVIEVVFENNTIGLHNKIRVSKDDFEYQHLYFITDDEIKEGDYVIYNSTQQLFIANKEVGCSSQGMNKLKTYSKVIVSTDISLNLPKPSQAFIKKYCDKGGINEVMIEQTIIRYEPADRGHDNMKLKVDKNNEITIKSIQTLFTKDDLFQAYCLGRDSNKDDVGCPSFDTWFNNNF